MPKYSSRIPPQHWEDRKSHILALYTIYTLSQVLESITTPGFRPSANQLREKITKWMCKKNLTLEERQKINLVIERNHISLDECNVVVRGVVQSTKTTLQEYVRTRNRSYRGLSPTLPVHIQLRIPLLLTFDRVMNSGLGKYGLRVGTVHLLGVLYVTKVMVSGFQGAFRESHLRRDISSLQSSTLENTFENSCTKLLRAIGTGYWSLIDAFTKECCDFQQHSRQVMDINFARFMMQSACLIIITKVLEERHRGNPFWRLDREYAMCGIDEVFNVFFSLKSDLNMTTAQRSSPVEKVDMAPTFPSLVWTAAEREDPGIATEEPAREGWETLVNWNG